MKFYPRLVALSDKWFRKWNPGVRWKNDNVCADLKALFPYIYILILFILHFNI